MDFSPAPKPRRAEMILPMINVVFLLLIFFLMTAQIAPPEPLEVDSPQAAKAGDPSADTTLYVSALGDLAYGEARGDAAMAALSELLPQSPALKLKVDAALPGVGLARLMKQLSGLGFSKVELIVVTP